MKRNIGPFYAAPLAVWLTGFFIVPLGIIAFYSFMSKGVYGGVVYRVSFDGYTALFNPTFLAVALSTFLIAASSSAIMVVLALPAAYFIARSPRKNIFLFLGGFLMAAFFFWSSSPSGQISLYEFTPGSRYWGITVFLIIFF